MTARITWCFGVVAVILSVPDHAGSGGRKKCIYARPMGGGQCGAQNIWDGLLPTKTSHRGIQFDGISSGSRVVGVGSGRSGPAAAGCQRWFMTWLYLACVWGGVACLGGCILSAVQGLSLVMVLPSGGALYLLEGVAWSPYKH
ncbi:hypothetical protein BC826DRAFT_1175764 [Russula brevipes]|nr:hypothetical protein BC826DRAFT_1175764 [Russula brevipes]